MLVNVNIEDISTIVAADLQESLDYFEEEIEREDCSNIFSTNNILEKMELQRHIDAFRIALSWYKQPN